MGVQSYLEALDPRKAPQTQPIPGREARMAKNAAGGYGFQVDDWTRLDRFLVLGSAGGTYYSGERELTLENAAVVRRCMAEDGAHTVARIAVISDAGRAPKNDPAILALAMCAKLGDAPTRAAAYAAVPTVCRIGTHIFDFAAAVDAMGGWSRGSRRAVRTWYDTRGTTSPQAPGFADEMLDPEGQVAESELARQRDAALAYQLVKYRQRNGWTHRDLLRLSHHPHTPLLAWAAGKRYSSAAESDPEIEGPLPEILGVFEELQATRDPKRAAQLISVYRMPWEAVPTELHQEPMVWEALLAHMPPMALLRNLGRLTHLGVVKPFSDGLKTAVATLTSADRLSKARVHPMAVLLAGRVYGQGHGILDPRRTKAGLTWTPVSQINDALDAAFYASMAGVAPTGKRTLVAVDVSGSMQYYRVADYPITAAEAAAAMACVLARTETDYHIMGFTTHPYHLDVSPKMRFQEVFQATALGRSEGTDVSVPMRWARQQGLAAETIIVLTDNETWAGKVHPAIALEDFRRHTQPGARFIDAAFTATATGVGDTVDPLTLHCVGLDAALPEIVRSFAAGEF